MAIPEILLFTRILDQELGHVLPCTQNKCHSIDGYANHKDMSEFCKRQVSPSMLFGASLDDSHLNVLYYSKLNVPYSCMVTIRTEPPYVIVLVIDVMNEPELRDVCSKNREPMAVYHIKPTYGGYWGSLPDHLMSIYNKDNHSKVYTLKTTTETTTSTVQEGEAENVTETVYTERIPTWVEEFVVTKEIPLMNISGNFQLEGRPVHRVQDLLDENDVTRIEGEDYITSLVPLAKFYPILQTDRHIYFNTSHENPSYEPSHYNTREDSITIDPRLFYTTKRKGIFTKKNKWIANRRKHFNNKHNNSMKSTRNNFYKRFFKSRPTTHKMYHTLKIFQETVTKTRTPITESQTQKSRTNTLGEYNIPFKQDSANDKSLTILSTDENAKNKEQFAVTKQLNTIARTVETETETLAQASTRELVDRESWENIVKVAPVLATMLNSTVAIHGTQSTHSQETSKNKAKKGNIKRRSFQPVDFELAEPRKLDNSVVDYYDMFYELNAFFTYNLHAVDNSERTDDDTTLGRNSMQNLTSNKEELIVNICDISQQQGKTHWIQVLETSEIIVVVNNFTLDKVRLIVTPGFALFDAKEPCPAEHVECQINGTRVCIDSTLACDGVPNCGTNSTNDEDRVSCELSGTRHVVVAALACLVVVVAAVYTLQSWVSRCVPRVSGAFFVYTDQSENTLFLHTVMRSPNDVDAEPDASLSGQFSFVDLTNPDLEVKLKENLCRRITRKCFYCITCNRVKKDKGDVMRKKENVEQIELTEKELQKIMPQKDEIIQTESSLEMKTINLHGSDKNLKDDVKTRKELDFIKYVNEKSNTLRSSLELEKKNLVTSPEVLLSITEESEVESTVYVRKDDSPVLQKNLPKPKERTSDINPIELVEKHLRFLENPTLIPDQADNSGSQNVETDYNRPSYSGIGAKEETTNNESKENKEFSRHYWKLPIGRKSKNPPKK